MHSAERRALAENYDLHAGERNVRRGYAQGNSIQYCTCASNVHQVPGAREMHYGRYIHGIGIRDTIDT
eukprot:scaffold267012_cov28-Tisochrysis_lutea.AAC.2